MFQAMRHDVYTKNFWKGNYLKDLSQFKEKFKKQNNEEGLQTKKRVIKKMYRYLHEFCLFSTFHGCKQLAARGRHWTEYVLWTIILGNAVALTLIVVNSSWIRFQKYPTVIVVEKDNQHWNITFPTGIICPYKKVDRDALMKLTYQYGVKNRTAFVEFFEALSLSDFETFNYLPDYDEVPAKDFLRIIIDAAYNFTYNITSTLSLDKDDLDPIYTELGICYTYNSKIAPFFNPKSVIGKTPAAERSRELYYCNTLDGVSFASVHGYSDSFNMTITGPYEVPVFGTSFETISSRGFQEFDTACLPIIATMEVRQLRVEQRNCRTRGDGSLRISQIYSYNLCRMECRLNLAVKLCGCIPYMYINEAANFKTGRVPICDVQGLKCLSKNGTLIADLRDPVSRQRVPCDCYPLCTDFHFRVLDTDIYSLQIGRTRWQIKNYPHTRYKRTIIFGFSDFLVGMGATAGLFLGCSVLSFVELFYFFSLRLVMLTLEKNKKIKENSRKMLPMQRKTARMWKFTEFE